MKRYRHMVGKKPKHLHPCDYHMHSKEERKQCAKETEKEMR
jgi:hypothetical protein